MVKFEFTVAAFKEWVNVSDAQHHGWKWWGSW